MNFLVDEYLIYLKEKLLHSNNWQTIILTRNWAKSVPSQAGVYVIKDETGIIYVGETGNLRGRMLELLNSRHHSFRRTLGERLYSTNEGFIKATEKKKFPDQFEILLDEYITNKLAIAYSEVPLGRKELEELIHSELDVDFKINKRGKREK